jgi:hypothetical protein
MIHDAASTDTLGRRRLRAAADMAYASARYGDAAMADAEFHGLRPHHGQALQAAAECVTQTRLVYDDARADHERALRANARGALTLREF